MSTNVLTRKNSSALVLNKAGDPYDIWDWERAITAHIKGDAIVLHDYDTHVIRTGIGVTGKSTQFSVPSVILIPNAPVKASNYVTTLPPTRHNLLHRDKYKCCYCGKSITLKDATVEHVYPQSKGGRTTWENCRMACQPCNHIKADQLLSDLGWSLRPVSTPRLSRNVSKHLLNKVDKIHHTWEPYIDWEVDWGS